MRSTFNNASALENVFRHSWDVVIIGSGIGGGAAAYALARSGKRVLLIERGRSYATNTEVVFDGLQTLRKKHSEVERIDLLKNAGLFWDMVNDVTGPKSVPFQPYIGSGVGGSSSLFAMAMERFRPQDFCPGPFFAGISEANVPSQWPISYAELAPCYKEAERLYRVRGVPDPLGPKDICYGYEQPPPLSPSNLEVVRILRSNGLHPYYQPMACEYREGCRECSGVICPAACRNDSFRRCIEPAVSEFGATLLEECEAVYLKADRRRVTAIECLYRGTPIVLKADTVVLSAGALQSPALLLKSRSAEWPYGLANSHDLVGRYFMRHFVDLFFVRPERELLQGELTKQVSFNDFYMNAGTKLGTVQSLGPMPPLDGALENFEISISQRWAGFSLAMPLVRPIIKLLTHNMSRALVYASILEDLPYAENRVTYDCIRSQICMSYRIHEEAWRRIRRFRALCLSAFTPLPVRLMKLAHIPWNIAHQVGTCRFGTSPKNSVLDRHCRAHELDNLFVLDGSFMPTSAGINPSLTIAANALRVAAEIGR